MVPEAFHLRQQLGPTTNLNRGMGSAMAVVVIQFETDGRIRTRTWSGGEHSGGTVTTSADVIVRLAIRVGPRRIFGSIRREI